MNRKPSGRQYINYAFYKLSSNWYELSKNKRKNISQKLLNILEKLDAKVGETIKFKNVLLLNDNKNTEIGNPSIDGAIVEAKLLDNVKDRTVLIFHKRRRKHSRKKKWSSTKTFKNSDY